MNFPSKNSSKFNRKFYVNSQKRIYNDTRDKKIMTYSFTLPSKSSHKKGQGSFLFIRHE